MRELETLAFHAKRKPWDDLCAGLDACGPGAWPPIMLDGHGLIRVTSYEEDGDGYKVHAELVSEYIFAFDPKAE